MILKTFAFFASVASVLCCFVACDGQTLAGKWKYKEISRTKSPDGLVEAVVISGSAGATTSTAISLHLIPTGESVDITKEADMPFVADHIKGLKIVWKPSGLLLDIEFDEARIIKFSNFWRQYTARKVVEVRLRPTDPDSILPARDKVLQ